MKNTYKMLLAGAMAAIMSMSLFGCDGKNKETLDSTESGSSLDYLGEYSEEEGDDYLTASVGIYDKDNEHECALDALEEYKKNIISPDIIKSAEIDNDSVKLTVVEIDENNPVCYNELEFIFTYNGDKYLFKYRWEDLNYDTLFSGVKTANEGMNFSATYRFDKYTTTLSRTNILTTSRKEVVDTATAMCNSVKNKINNLFIQFENEEGLPTFPEGAVIEKDYLRYYTKTNEKLTYEFYFTYNGNRYLISFMKYLNYSFEEDKYFTQKNKVSVRRVKYLYANWSVGCWNIGVKATNDNVTEEEITALATLLRDSMLAE